jgi:SAM-dependent methyltransferase
MAEFKYKYHYAQWYDGSAEQRAVGVRHATSNLRRLADRLPTSGRALDVGCGHGFTLQALASSGYDANGIDASEDQVAEARTAGLRAEVNSDLATWANGHEGTYDLVTMYDVLEHVPVNAQLDFLEGAYRVLKPGGSLLIQTPNAASPAASFVRYVDWTHTSSFTTTSLMPLLQSVGFTDFWFAPDLLDSALPRRGISEFFYVWAKRVRFAPAWLFSVAWRAALKRYIGPHAAHYPLDANLTVTCRKPGNSQNIPAR